MAKPALGRLKKRAEFQRLTAKGRKWAAPGLVLQALPQVDTAQKVDTTQSGATTGETPIKRASPGIRLGFTCSRQIGGAVDRNRARRRLKEAAAQIMHSAARSGYDYVLIGRKATLHRPFPLLIEDLRQALKRVGAAAHESH